jgi:hypothetical protein
MSDDARRGIRHRGRGARTTLTAPAHQGLGDDSEEASVPEQSSDLRVPGDGERWRCAGCGNLTRFDVTRTRRTTEYWHFDLAGEHQVEEETVRSEVVESVSCRWCGRHDAIEVVDRASADTSADPAAG